jgi:hypothetical protein
MAEGHGVPEQILLECPTLLVEGLLLLFDVLLDESTPVVIKVLEYKGIFVRICRLPLCLCL